MATIMAPWTPVTIWLALAVMPGEDNQLILGSKTLRKKLDVDVMKQLREMAAQAFAEVPAMPPKVASVRSVTVTIEAMQQVADT